MKLGGWPRGVKWNLKCGVCRMFGWGVFRRMGYEWGMVWVVVKKEREVFVNLRIWCC